MTHISKSFLKKIEKLPTLPVIAQKIMNLNYDQLFSIERLNSIVEKDPAIAAKILSVANSAFFGNRDQTPILYDAIMRIGFNNVKSIALGISMLSLLDDGKKVAEYTMIFNHSIAVSLAARSIANTVKVGNEEDVLTEGLLHDLGLMVLCRYVPNAYEDILDKLDSEGSLLAVENELFNSSHAEIGYWLATQWNLPDTIINTILYHHTPSLSKNAKHAALIHISDYIVTKNICSPIKKDPNYALDRNSFDILSISNNDLKDIEQSVCNIHNKSDNAESRALY